VGWTQSYRLMHYTLADGLPSNTIYEMAQDKRGYMWFGTEGGLCRFDGQRFKSYFHEALRDIEIILIHTSPTGRIGFVNLSGQIGFVEQDSIKVLPQFGEKGKAVRDYFEDDEGNVWVGLMREDGKPPASRVGVYKLDSTFNLIKKLPQFGATIRVMGWNPLRKESFIDGETGAYLHKPVMQDSFFKLENYDYYPPKIQYDHEGFILMELRPSRVRCVRDGKVHTVKVDPLISPSYLFLDIERGPQGYYWLATSEGLFKCEMEDFYLKVVEKPILDGTKVNCLTFDKEGNLWMGTEKSGVYILPQYPYRQWDGRSAKLGPFRSRLLSLDQTQQITTITSEGVIIKATDTTFTELELLDPGGYKGVLEGPN
ncbi:MAG: two-component regulator propeller domain-containing protein, partial [Bacteroidota bacterium]